MKKYFILAAVALVALTACSKIEVSNTVPDRAISFQVANYVAQTKAGESAFDINDTFKTSAWFHPLSGDAQIFMDKETIKWQSASTQWA
nr:lipoprotein [Bacteroidaceae bacterium]